MGRAWFNRFVSEIAFIARIEAALYTRHPRLLVATLVVALIPSLYVLIYLSSVWDPTANTGALPVAIVNLDQRVDYQGQSFNMGQEVSTKLKAKHQFGYREFSDEDEARLLVRQGKLAFALIVPRDFSSNAIPGAEAGAGKLEIYLSEGNSYQSASLARHFADALGHEVNDSLNEQRWALVLTSALGSKDKIERLRNGVSQVQSGAQALAAATHQTAAGAESLRAGTERLHQGVGKLTVGVKELGAGVRSMDEHMPPASELNRLKQGAEALASGQGELGRGLGELRAGTQRMKSGVGEFHEEAKDSLLVSARLTDGLGQLNEGLSQLDGGLQTATSAQQKLAENAERLATGVGALTTGVSGLGAGLKTMLGKMPADRQLEQLSGGSATVLSGTEQLLEGSKQVDAGAVHLSTGIDLLAGALPASVLGLGGSAKGLANSVRPIVEVTAAVKNNGSGFAPNIIPAALWLGAGIAVFLIHIRLQASAAKDFSRPAQVLGKMLVPAGISLLQAGLVIAMVVGVLGIDVAHPVAFVLTLGISSLTFLAIVFALIRALGDAGKGLALLFLAVQLSSSGGILPVELSGRVFVDISPWLPLTWVVRAIKATLFGAYDGAWLFPLLLVAMAGLLAGVMACWVGRWRYVEPGEMRPALDL